MPAGSVSVTSYEYDRPFSTRRSISVPPASLTSTDCAAPPIPGVRTILAVGPAGSDSRTARSRGSAAMPVVDGAVAS